MAIGANRSDVVRMVLRQGIILAMVGLVIGLIASVGADRALEAMFAGGPGGDNRTDVGGLPAGRVDGAGGHPAGRLCPGAAGGAHQSYGRAALRMIRS